MCEILFLVIKFVLSKINLTWHITNRICNFCCVFEWTGWDVCFIVILHSTLFFNTISLKLVVAAYWWSHSSVQWKELPRSSPWTFLSKHTFLTPTMKSRQNECNLTFLQDKFFFHSQVSKYTAMLSEFSFPKKRKK